MTVPIIVIIVIVVIILLVCGFVRRRRHLARVVNNATSKAANTAYPLQSIDQNLPYSNQLPPQNGYAGQPVAAYPTGQYADPSYPYPTSYPQEPYATGQPPPPLYFSGGEAPPVYPN